METYLDSKIDSKCFGCEACAQICPKYAIVMKKNNEGFRYPEIDESKCIHCNLCRKVCPYNNMPPKNQEMQYAWGGYHKDWEIRNTSTSGGAFSAIVDAFCDDNYIIFGATANGLEVFHTYVEDKHKMQIFRKSKYLQSNIRESYIEVRKFLQEGKKVLFSGTPCQIAGLKTFLQNEKIDNLLTVEVICEGVPSPYYMKKYEQYLKKNYSSPIKTIDYRYTDGKKSGCKERGKWDFQIMKIEFENGKEIKKDRWINPFWQVWLNHLMSRPSCYNCKFTTSERIADITLGDLWGVHLYCPELYGKNGGASLVICNSKKGKKVFEKAKENLYGHELDFELAKKYQSPLRKSISTNPKRKEFMDDLLNNEIDYKKLCKKWYKKPSLKLLFSKYIWGNRQKIWLWNLKNKWGGNRNE